MRQIEFFKASSASHREVCRVILVSHGNRHPNELLDIPAVRIHSSAEMREVHSDANWCEYLFP